MPNGGSDCCGTCCFNRANGGEREYRNRDDSITPYCEIRNAPIENPFYTYCANHPHRKSDRDPMPIGPITHGVNSGGLTYRREVWKPSPDSEEIRQHLLDLFEEFIEHGSRDWYPAGSGLNGTVIWQLGEFKEKRAEDSIRWISENLEGTLGKEAHRALAKIHRG